MELKKKNFFDGSGESGKFLQAIPAELRQDREVVESIHHIPNFYRLSFANH